MKTMGIVVAVLVSGLIGDDVRAADTYKLDPAHTSAGFTISHLVISEVSGRFDDVAGEITLDNDAVTGAKATIQTKSVDTGNSKRDDHLRSKDFFEVEKYPTITFEGTKVEKDDDKAVMVGKFTMHGVTKEIRLPFTIKGPIKDPWGNTRLAVTAEISLNRTDYGMKSFPGVGDEVKIHLSTEATAPKK
jgi:polyisoprenoid-binding protein YceI